MMKLWKGICWFCSILIVPDYGFCADVISENIYGLSNEFNGDKIILENVVVSPNNLIIHGFVEVENRGKIQTNIILTDGTSLFLRNTGDINADFDLGTGSVLYHKISTSDEIKYVDFNVNYTAFVESTEVLSLTGLIDVTNRADKVFIQNTKINIDGIPQDTTKHIELGENITFVLGNLTDLYEGVLLNDVRGMTDVNFVSENQNPMFSDYGYIKYNKLYVGHVRVTDYAKVYPNDLGVFLNSARESGKNDSLFLRLDSAMSYDELNNIMQDSVLFNKNKLFTPLRVINVLNFISNECLESNNMGGEIFGFSSDDFYAYGIGAKIGFNVIDDLLLYAGLQIGTIDYQNDTDTFSGGLYGVNLGAKYMLNPNRFVRGNIGFMTLDTDIDTVFYNNRIIKQPWVSSGYINADVGQIFDFIDDISVAPFVGVISEFYYIDGYNDFNSDLYIGTDISFDTDFSGIKYIYSARGAFNTDMSVMLNAKIGFYSISDSMGGDISASVSNTDNGISYKVSANTRIAF